MRCAKGHPFENSLACPICATAASKDMLLELMRRGIAEGEPFRHYCDHILLGPRFWNDTLIKAGCSVTISVPALCGADIPLADLKRAHRGKQQQTLTPCKTCVQLMQNWGSVASR